MTRHSKAVAQMRKEGIEAYTKGNGGAFVNLQAKGQLFQFELSYSDVEKWANLYDDSLVNEFNKK